MSFRDLLVREATVIQPGETQDRYGSRQPDWSAPALENTERCWLNQQGSTEDRAGGRDAVIVDAIYFAEPGSAVTAASRVIVDGTTYEVVGRPRSAWTPRGEHHIEADLKAVSG